MNYTITTKLPTLNEYINSERGSKYSGAALKKKFTYICAQCALIVKNKIDKNGLYDLEITWNVTDNKVDSDNLFFAVKLILDGLVSCGALSGDGRKHIRHISHKIFTTKKYLVNVELKAVTD